MHIKQFLTPTKSQKKAVVYDTVNNVIQVKEYDELKIDTSYKSIELKQGPGVKSPNSQQTSQQNSPAFKSQPNSPAVKQISQQNSPASAISPKQQISQPNSPVKQMQPRQQQFSPN
jgi:hypothetical protein